MNSIITSKYFLAFDACNTWPKQLETMNTQLLMCYRFSNKVLQIARVNVQKSQPFLRNGFELPKIFWVDTSNMGIYRRRINIFSSVITKQIGFTKIIPGKKRLLLLFFWTFSAINFGSILKHFQNVKYRKEKHW